MTLSKRWTQQIAANNIDAALGQKAWDELQQYYSESHRAYHNLQHLSALFELWESYHSILQNPDHVAWAIWYHDIIYNPRKRDNEEQSAVLASQRLTQFGLSKPVIEKIVHWIRATANHTLADRSQDPDLTWFLDFDLAILAAAPVDYQKYTQAIRQEYQHVPGFFYRRARKKVLRQFISQASIYHSPPFKKEKEALARTNISAELNTL